MLDKRYAWLAAILVALAIGFYVPGIAEAQGSDRKVEVGGKGGWTYSVARGDGETDEGDLIDLTGGNGFALGGLVAFEVHPNVTFQPEFLYTRKNFGLDVTAGNTAGDDVTGAIDADYFEIPVVAKLHGAGRTQGARPFGLLGATFSFLVTAEQTAQAGGMTETEDIKDDVTSVDVGLTVGGGVDFIQDWGVFTVDGRYNFGLRDLDDEGIQDIKSGMFLISAGVIF